MVLVIIVGGVTDIPLLLLLILLVSIGVVVAAHFSCRCHGYLWCCC